MGRGTGVRLGFFIYILLVGLLGVVWSVDR